MLARFTRRSQALSSPTFSYYSSLCGSPPLPQVYIYSTPQSPSTSASIRTAIMAERYIPEHRRTNYKAQGAFKQDELRRRREEQLVEIRKTKREENLAKRRGLGGRDAPGASLGAAPDSDDEGVNIESQVC